MIKFYPRDIGMWRNKFNFENDDRPYIILNDESGLKQFCAEYGVKLNDPEFPFEIITWDGDYYQFCVKQWTVIGWLNYEN